MNNSKNNYYNQKIDNELKKKKLEEKYNAQFSHNSIISPEFEKEWLNNIEEFEQQFSKNGTISVWKYIGKPVFKKIQELNPKEIVFELEKLTEIMNENNIYLDTLCKVDQDELYRFIIEELFEYKIDNIRIDGMNHIFIYEDFHPNAEYDILQSYDYFLSCTMSKMKNMKGDGYDLLYIDTSNFLNSKSQKLDKRTVVKKIHNFLNSVDYFEVLSNEVNTLTINEDKSDSEINFNINFIGCFNNSSETLNFKGEGIIKLKPSVYGGWDIYFIDMPGLRF